MSLSPGTRVGPYQIAASLGAGGMGEVYRARDTRLGRDVAIKVLPQRFRTDPEARARLAREARAASALNHSHICTVHDVGSEGAVDYLVMELVEGETLAARLERGPLPLDQLVARGIEIADALGSAHLHGILHRDLKPQNVMLTKAGAKLMDFGLASRSSDPVSHDTTQGSPTVSAPLTTEGTIVGTTQYIAPERLQGMPADARSDLWALGAVLHEMATATPAFQAASSAALIAAIIRGEPTSTAFPELDRVVRTLLAKDPSERFQSAFDVELVLKWITAGPAVAPGHTALARSWARRRETWVTAVALVLFATLGVVIGRQSASRAPVASGPTVHSVMPFPKGTQLAGWSSPAVALSPDGRSLAFAAVPERGSTRLFLRRLDRDETIPIPNSESAEGPFFSPDGQWVAFAVGVSGSNRRGELLKYSLATGITQSVCDLPDYFGGQWPDDDKILFVGEISKGLWTVSPGGGQPVAVAATFRIGGSEHERSLKWPQVLPGGRKAIAIAEGRIAVIDLQTRELRDTGIEAEFARYSPTGHLLYATPDATLMAAPFDRTRGKTTGPPVAVLGDIAVTASGAAVFAISSNGTLVYTTGHVRWSGNDMSEVVRIDRRGKVQPLPIKPATFSDLAVAPDGRRLALRRGGLWVYDMSRGTGVKLPAGGVFDRMYPVWTPDGRSLAFTGFASGASNLDLFLQAAEGNALPRLLGGTPGEDQAGSFTPDGGEIIFSTFHSLAKGGAAIWRLRLGPKAQPEKLSSGQQRERFPRVSPDGKLVAYEGLQSDRVEAFWDRFPVMGAEAPVSRDGGWNPRWSANGRELFFSRGRSLYAAPVEAGPEPNVGESRMLFEVPGILTFDVLPDGSGFIALRTLPDSTQQTQLQLVTNWFNDLRHLGR